VLLAIVAQHRTATNVALAAAAPPGVDARIMSPAQAAALLRPGAAAVGRIDVSEALDGPADGLWALGTLAARGVRVLNRAGALLAAHDKLLTAHVLQRDGLPHPRTRVLHPDEPVPEWDGPVVVKPRFGSWGREVVRCDDDAALRRHLSTLESRRWFQQHGAIVLELMPPRGRDFRVVVAGGVPVGAIARIAAAGEWRTNVSAGGTRAPVEPPVEALELAVRAAAAADTDLVGVDLLPLPDGGFTVLELNGAVDFTREYALDRDPFVAAGLDLARLVWEPEAAVA
jgi:RimK family alpha-L-glutamate ligase